MACSYNMWRMATRSWSSALPHGSHNLASIRASIISPRYALNNFHSDGKRLQRNTSHLPRTAPDPPRLRDLRSITEEFKGAIDEAAQEKLFEEYLKTPMESVSGTPQSVADVLVTENSRIVRSSFVYAGLIGALVFGGAVVLSQADTKSLARTTSGSTSSIKDLRATRERLEMSAAQRSIDILRKYLNKGLLQYYAQ